MPCKIFHAPALTNTLAARHSDTHTHAAMGRVALAQLSIYYYYCYYYHTVYYYLPAFTTISQRVHTVQAAGF